MNPSVENRFYDLLSRKLAGDCKTSELEELESILQRHPQVQLFYNQMMTHSPGLPDAEIEAAYAWHRAKMYPEPEPTKSKRVISLLKWSLVAASIVAVLGLTWLVIEKTKRMPENKQTIVSSGRDSRSAMTLPDGTIVRLNAKSKVSYAEGFGQSTREVFLTGEAYFEVTHNERVPFIVHTEEADIKVLGTKFNVRNYANEHKMEAALLTGSIELTLLRDTQHKILLKPSDKLIVKKKAAGEPAVLPAAGDKNVELTSIKMQDSVIVETSWLNDKMAFVDKPFSEIALDLERQFDVSIAFKNEAVSEYKYTGVYDEDNAAGILKILQMIKPFQYTINNKQITIY